MSVVLQAGDLTFARATARATAGRPRIEELLRLPMHASTFSGATMNVPRLWHYLRADATVGRHMRKPFCAVMPADSYTVLQVNEPELRDVTLEQRRESLRWVIKELISFSVEDAAIDILSRSGQQTFVVAAARDQVQPIAQSADEAGFNLRAIDVRESAQRNFAHLFESDARPLPMALLNVVGDHALLTITDQGELLMSRRIDVLPEEVNESLSRWLVDSREVRDRMVLEVQRTLDNFDRMGARAGLQQLLVAPGPSAQALAQDLIPALGVQVIQIDAQILAEAIDVPAGVLSSLGDWDGSEVLALGAALRAESLS